MLFVLGSWVLPIRQWYSNCVALASSGNLGEMQVLGYHLVWAESESLVMGTQEFSLWPRSPVVLCSLKLDRSSVLRRTMAQGQRNREG